MKEKIASYLDKFCYQIPNRHVGSPGNLEATDFFAETIRQFGFRVECPEFDCIDWEFGKVRLAAGSGKLEALVGPYSLPFSGKARLVAVSTIDELEKSELAGKIILIHGELAKEQIMPINFPFYNPEEHQTIVRLLEDKQPAAIISATSRNPETAGGVYPFPLFEDGDFDIPSVYMKDTEGKRLLPCAGSEITLAFESRRIPAKGCNVVARKGGEDAAARIVFCAHIDAKKGTPGALDNATGVATLLALAEKLQNYHGELMVEIVALNGEDYYAAPGQILYLQQNKEKLDSILLAINMDGAGFHQANTMFSLFELPEPMAAIIKNILRNECQFDEGPQWYQSDHSIFIQNGCPAVAITSSNLSELCTNITHNPKDRPELVSCEKLAEIAEGLRQIVEVLDQ